MGTGPSTLYDYYAIRLDAPELQAHAPKKRVAPEAKSDEVHTVSHLDANAAFLHPRFKVQKDGCFCERGRGTGINKRQYISDDPLSDAVEFFEALSRGGSSRRFPKGIIKTLDDGTRITFREVTSTPDSPAVEIGRSASQFIKNQKIHFERGSHG